MAEPQPAPNPGHLNTIPPAIRRQAERAEQLQREASGQPEPAPVTPGQPPAPAPAQPPPQPPQTPQPPPAAAAGDVDERVRTAEGRLAVEREKRQGLEAQVGNLNRMVAELQAAQRAPAAAPAPVVPLRGKLVTAEEEADYGADLLTVMGKRARDEVAGEINDLKTEIQNLKGQVGQVGTRVAARDTEDVFSELHRQVPGWVDQNSDENFILWLQQPEPFSGIKRHDLLSRAFDSHDAGRVIRFFQGFRAEAATTGQAPGQFAPPPAPAANGKVPLENFAAPGRAAPAQATAPQGERNLYTRAQIAQFYTDKAAGKWRGRETEATNLESDIFRAGPEGRVVG